MPYKSSQHQITRSRIGASHEQLRRDENIKMNNWSSTLRLIFNFTRVIMFSIAVISKGYCAVETHLDEFTVISVGLH
jgi:hypothetical protein